MIHSQESENDSFPQCPYDLLEAQLQANAGQEINDICCLMNFMTGLI